MQFVAAVLFTLVGPDCLLLPEVKIGSMFAVLRFAVYGPELLTVLLCWASRKEKQPNARSLKNQPVVLGFARHVLLLLALRAHEKPRFTAINSTDSAMLFNVNQYAS